MLITMCYWGIQASRRRNLPVATTHFVCTPMPPTRYNLRFSLRPGWQNILRISERVETVGVTIRVLASTRMISLYGLFRNLPTCLPADRIDGEPNGTVGCPRSPICL